MNTGFQSDWARAFRLFRYLSVAVSPGSYFAHLRYTSRLAPANCIASEREGNS